jgi:hypothetical protein
VDAATAEEIEAASDYLHLAQEPAAYARGVRKKTALA